MIHVQVKASSPIARTGLETLIRNHHGFLLVSDDSVQGESAASTEWTANVLVVEAETPGDPAVREALDWASAGGSVVLLLRNPSSESIADALRDGIKSVLPSGLTGTELVTAIEAAAAGFVVLDEHSAEAMLGSPTFATGIDSNASIEPLTPREIEVLRLLALGLGNKEIAARLEISEHTVKFHVASILSKLGAASRTEAVTLGIRHGLVML
jgi:two-component system, NarL family, response regulator YdfI